MKEKTLILLVGLFLVTGCSLFGDKEPEKPVELPKVEEEEKLPQEGQEVKVTEKEKEVFETLSDYGKKIYNDKSYSKIKKQEDGTYFISANTLKEKFNYDISIIDSKCDFDKTGVIIDVDRKVYTKLPEKEEPIVAIMSCE